MKLMLIAASAVILAQSSTTVGAQLFSRHKSESEVARMTPEQRVEEYYAKKKGPGLQYGNSEPTNSAALSITSRPLYPMATDYIYDTLNRVTDVQYPAQYPVGNTRKVVHHDYDVASRLTGLKVDNADSWARSPRSPGAGPAKLQFQFNTANQPTQMTYPSGRVTTTRGGSRRWVHS